MLTDRVPIEYLYLSRRLLTDLHEQNESQKPRRRWTVTLGLPLSVSVARQPRALDLSNLKRLAYESEELIRDNTGTVEQPGIYIRDTVEMYGGTFQPLIGWTGWVATYRAELDLADSGRVIAALFGSASNIVGWRSDGRSPVEEGFYPSDMSGLYGILDSIREREDPEMDLDYRIEDEGLDPIARAEYATLFARSAKRPIGRVDFAARLFDDVSDVQLDGSDVRGRVLLGTPLWIATPTPRPMS